MEQKTFAQTNKKTPNMRRTIIMPEDVSIILFAKKTIFIDEL